MTSTPHLANWRLSFAAFVAALLTAATFAALTGSSKVSFPTGPAPSAPAPAAAPAAKLTPQLDALAAKRPNQRVEVIVQLAARTPSADGRRMIESAGGEVGRHVKLINAFGAEMTAAAAKRLAAERSVHSVTLNARVEGSGYDTRALATSFNQSVRATEAWNDKDEPTTGKGVAVAVLDTGIDGSHPDFKRADGSSRIVASAVVNPNATTVTDRYGHGTHVAGLIAGNSFHRPSSDKRRGKYLGTAPDADLVNVKISDDEGNASLLDVIDGLQFVVDHKDKLNIRVANLSLNSTVAQSYKIDPLDAAVEQAWFAGIVVVTAAGNAGTDGDAVAYAPANDPYVVTVGAVDDKRTKSVTDDVITRWSSRGTTQDGFAKPEIVAPGAHLVAPLPAKATYRDMCPSCVVDDQYISLGGTSMSAAVASGVAADVISFNPSWTPDEVKGAMINKTHAVVLEGTSQVVGNEPSTPKAAETSANSRLANAGLTPNELIDPTTGALDFNRLSWRRLSWRDASDLGGAEWNRLSWRSVDPQTEVVDGDTLFSRLSWRRLSWRTSFDK